VYMCVYVCMCVCVYVYCNVLISMYESHFATANVVLLLVVCLFCIGLRTAQHPL